MSILYKKIYSLLEDISDIDRASDPTTDPKALEMLAEHPNTEVKHAVAGNPATPEHVLTVLATKHKKNDPIHNVLAGNPNISPELINKYLQTHTPITLENPTVKLLPLLDPSLKTLHPSTLVTMARNSQDPDLLDALSNHPNFMIRHAALQNEKIPNARLEKYFNSKPDEDYDELNLVTSHPKTPAKMIDAITTRFPEIRDDLDQVGINDLMYNIMKRKDLTAQQFHNMQPYVDPFEFTDAFHRQQDGNERLHDEFINHPQTTSHLLGELASIWGKWYKEGVSSAKDRLKRIKRHPNVGPTTRYQISKYLNELNK